MSVNEEIVQQDANSGDTSAPQTQPDSQLSEPSSQESQSAPDQSESKLPPLHEHPRFKELIEDNRNYKSRLSEYETRMADFERRYQEAVQSQQPKPEKKTNPFVEKLREIDPAYAEYIESIEARASKAEQVEARFTEMENERIRTQYDSSMSRLQAEHKLPPQVSSLVKQQVDALVMSGQVKDLKEVPAAYKNIAEQYTKMLDELKRSERAQYVTEKSTDARQPSSQPKGKPATRDDKGRFMTGDREDHLALIAQKALRVARGESEF